jgi:hypothetical protein
MFSIDEEAAIFPKIGNGPHNFKIFESFSFSFFLPYEYLKLY